CRFGTIRFEGQRLPQRRDRTGDALPQDALVVAQPSPAHVCGSCLDPDRGSNFDFGLDSVLDSRLLVFAGFLSSAGFSAFFAAGFSVGFSVVLASFLAAAGSDGLAFAAAVSGGVASGLASSVAAAGWAPGVSAGAVSSDI